MAQLLLIDDDALVRSTLRQILERAGHTVLEASNGGEGLTRLAGQAIDLMITDIIMPEKEGVETIVETRKRHPTLPIIAISGGGRTKNMDFLDVARQVGATETLAKPFRPQILVELVAKLLTKSP
ncbi:MAG: response regulator [Alphaproteobacteria bacterium]|nr:response regulator [Alphaproteobacteria bacterium]MBU0796759.1 response regulator [Alphaproteobacteria bacterium]MBU0888277.1 response regulator [Alphaproteobacteria bacterium]MBU1811478.1 response regulator [Alphaproteobacteria bacterium]MBU2089547.1 response regulator [Alphaproteobacteria bacterium]